ncbi:hypothetical protein PIB30_069067 [Stylosanthes scabra]|uniref:Uncharacterized protein n=1 Tax=Stylosanthes scabra TaxID=79078 RepID=A0ABU6TNL4_9FABA|nr:hypothetical protein [Stylosanthes scabra]
MYSLSIPKLNQPLTLVAILVAVLLSSQLLTFAVAVLHPSPPVTFSVLVVVPLPSPPLTTSRRHHHSPTPIVIAYVATNQSVTIIGQKEEPLPGLHRYGLESAPTLAFE